MRSLGEAGGLDLTQDTKPPKNLYVEVSIPMLPLPWTRGGCPNIVWQR